MKQKIPLLLLLLPILLLSVAVDANQTKLYKWVDAQGNVHFGDQASARTDAEEMVVKTNDPSASTAANPADDKQQPIKGNGEECKEARKQLDEYTRAPFLYETSADGKRHIVPEDQRQELLNNVKERVKTVCGQ